MVSLVFVGIVVKFLVVRVEFVKGSNVGRVELFVILVCVMNLFFFRFFINFSDLILVRLIVDRICFFFGGVVLSNELIICVILVKLRKFCCLMGDLFCKLLIY